MSITPPRRTPSPGMSAPVISPLPESLTLPMPCASGARCQWRQLLKEEQQRTAKLVAANAVLRETQQYLVDKCSGTAHTLQGRIQELEKYIAHTQGTRDNLRDARDALEMNSQLVTRLELKQQEVKHLRNELHDQSAMNEGLLKQIEALQVTVEALSTHLSETQDALAAANDRANHHRVAFRSPSAGSSAPPPPSSMPRLPLSPHTLVNSSAMDVEAHVSALRDRASYSPTSREEADRFDAVQPMIAALRQLEEAVTLPASGRGTPRPAGGAAGSAGPNSNGHRGASPGGDSTSRGEGGGLSVVTLLERMARIEAENRDLRDSVSQVQRRAREVISEGKAVDEQALAGWRARVDEAVGLSQYWRGEALKREAERVHAEAETRRVKEALFEERAGAADPSPAPASPPRPAGYNPPPLWDGSSSYHRAGTAADASPSPSDTAKSLHHRSWARRLGGHDGMEPIVRTPPKQSSRSGTPPKISAAEPQPPRYAQAPASPTASLPSSTRFGGASESAPYSTPTTSAHPAASREAAVDVLRVSRGVTYYGSHIDPTATSAGSAARQANLETETVKSNVEAPRPAKLPLKLPSRQGVTSSPLPQPSQIQVHTTAAASTCHRTGSEVTTEAACRFARSEVALEAAWNLGAASASEPPAAGGDGAAGTGCECRGRPRRWSRFAYGRRVACRAGGGGATCAAACAREITAEASWFVEHNPRTDGNGHPPRHAPSETAAEATAGQLTTEPGPVEASSQTSDSGTGGGSGRRG
jgi:hypothetical protein